MTNAAAAEKQCGAGRRSVFRPRATPVGWVSSLSLLTGLALTVRFLIEHSIADPVSPIAVGVISVVVAFFTCLLPTMRYEVASGKVLLRCGPFKWTIPVAEITGIAEHDLKYVPLSEGWKLPGYALFSMHVGPLGVVRMCSTAVSRRVLVITTPRAQWGITPADVDGFVDAVRLEKQCQS